MAVQRKKRSDAAARCEAVLDAAEDVFAEHGHGAPLGLICERAAVGRATLYRNFENREALIAALFARNLVRLEKIAARPAGSEGQLREFLAAVQGMQMKTGALFQVVHETGPISAEVSGRFRRILGDIHAAARANGELRPDIGVADIEIVIDMMALAGGHAERDRHLRAGRALVLCLSALTTQ